MILGIKNGIMMCLIRPKWVAGGAIAVTLLLLYYYSGLSTKLTLRPALYKGQCSFYLLLLLASATIYLCSYLG